MPQQVGIWQVTGQGPKKLPQSQIALEQHLEDWIERDPALLDSTLAIVGRQIMTEAGKLDLLGIDPQGRWFVIELKRGLVNRDTIAQAIDYAACITEMSAELLTQKVNAYLANQPGDQTLEKLLADRPGAKEAFEGEREVLIFVAGTGRDPGLERIEAYLKDRLPIRVVTFSVYEADGTGTILVRELSEYESEVGETPPHQTYSIEAACALADQNGLGQEVRAVLAAAQSHGLHVRPWKNALMFSSPQEKRRALFTCWAVPRHGNLLVWVGPQVFTEYFPSITAEQAAADIGDGYRELPAPGGPEAFIQDLDRLFEHIGQAQSVEAEPTLTEFPSDGAAHGTGGPLLG